MDQAWMGDPALADFQTRMEGGASRLRKNLGARDRRDERDGRGFEVRSSRFSERRTPNFGSRLSRMSRASGATVYGAGRRFHQPARWMVRKDLAATPQRGSVEWGTVR